MTPESDRSAQREFGTVRPDVHDEDPYDALGQECTSSPGDEHLTEESSELPQDSGWSDLVAIRTTGAAEESQVQEWLGRICHQDEDALAELYRATIGRVYGVALRIVRDPGIAEEVAEDTYWQVWRQAPRYDSGRGTAHGWMLAIARSRALDALRARGRNAGRTASLESMGDIEADSESASGLGENPQDLLSAVQTNRLLHAALVRLEPIARQLIALAFFRGLTHDEIAGHTGMPLGTVKSHIRRAVVHLREWLTAEVDDGVARYNGTADAESAWRTR